MTDNATQEAADAARTEYEHTKAARRRKLPVWAQDQLAHQERTIATLEARLAQGPEDSNTVLDPYARVPRPIGSDPTVCYQYEGVEIEVRFRKGVAEVSVSARCNDRMVVMPWVSNVVHITSAPR